MTTTLVNPLNENLGEAVKPAPRLPTLEDKKIALLDISKPGGRQFLDRVEELLKTRYRVREVLRVMKPTFTKPAPEEIYQRILKAQVQGIIEALAD